MNKDVKSSLKALLKRNSAIYTAYYFVMTFVVNVIKLFVQPDDKLILFVSFGGRRYTDSPRAMYELMKSDRRFDEYKLVWGFVNPDDFPEVENKVKLDTLAYYKTSIKSKCWITNVHIERGLNYKRKETFYLYTGHGSPIKKEGNDNHSKQKYKSKKKNTFDSSLAQSEYEQKIRSSIFTIPQDEVYLTGAPTNDILANYDDVYRNNIRKDLGIPDNKKAILYAPTYREYRHSGTFDTPEVDFEKWHNMLGDGFVILYRAHPIAMTDSIMSSEWFFDVTKFPNIEPLMIASDILVSDYSGLIPDYSIMKKPIYLWTYDFDQFEKTRGLYFDIRQTLPYAEDEESLLEMIKKGYTEEQKEMVLKFQKKYATVYGFGTRNAVDLVYSKILNK